MLGTPPSKARPIPAEAVQSTAGNPFRDNDLLGSIRLRPASAGATSDFPTGHCVCVSDHMSGPGPSHTTPRAQRIRRRRGGPQTPVRRVSNRRRIASKPSACERREYVVIASRIRAGSWRASTSAHSAMSHTAL